MKPALKGEPNGSYVLLTTATRAAHHVYIDTDHPQRNYQPTTDVQYTMDFILYHYPHVPLGVHEYTYLVQNSLLSISNL